MNATETVSAWLDTLGVRKRKVELTSFDGSSEEFQRQVRALADIERKFAGAPDVSTLEEVDWDALSRSVADSMKLHGYTVYEFFRSCFEDHQPCLRCGGDEDDHLVELNSLRDDWDLKCRWGA